MIVVLVEKPSVARDIATVLGANQKKDAILKGTVSSISPARDLVSTSSKPPSDASRDP